MSDSEAFIVNRRCDTDKLKVCVCVCVRVCVCVCVCVATAEQGAVRWRLEARGNMSHSLFHHSERAHLHSNTNILSSFDSTISRDISVFSVYRCKSFYNILLYCLSQPDKSTIQEDCGVLRAGTGLRRVSECFWVFFLVCLDSVRWVIFILLSFLWFGF